MTDRPPHDETAGDDCTCFGCHIGSIHLGRKQQTVQKIRPVEQPPSHYGAPFLLDRGPGAQVPIIDEGRMVTQREAATNKRHKVEELRRRQHHLSNPS